MHGEKAESEGVVMPVPYPGALVSLRWGPLLCPPLASLAFCRLQLQCAQQLRQLPGECSPREGAFGIGGGRGEGESFGGNSSCLSDTLV